MIRNISNKDLLHLYWGGGEPGYFTRTKLVSLARHLQQSHSDFIPLLWTDNLAYEAILKIRTSAKLILQYNDHEFTDSFYWVVTPGIKTVVFI